MTAPTIVVFGVTGELGGYVAKALAASYDVLGVTAELDHDRDIKDLEDCGIQVKRIAFSDDTGLEKALVGAVGCFVITDSDLADIYGYDNEVSQGYAIAAACARSRVPHVIYSTQLSVVHCLGIRARHMDAKAVVEKYMKELELPLTGLVVPFFYENLLTPPFRPVHVTTDSCALYIPMGATSLDAISVADVGGVALWLFDNRHQFLHKTLTISGDKVTVKEMAASLTRHLPPTRFKDKQVTLKDYRRMGFEGAEDLANMFDFYYHAVQRPSVDLTKRLYPDVKKFDDWVRANVQAIALAITGKTSQPPCLPLPWSHHCDDAHIDDVNNAAKLH